MVSVDEPVGDLCKVGAILCTRQEKLRISSAGQHLQRGRYLRERLSNPCA